MQRTFSIFALLFSLSSACKFGVVIPTHPGHFLHTVRLVKSLRTHEVTGVPVFVIFSDSGDATLFRTNHRDVNATLIAMDQILDPSLYNSFQNVSPSYKYSYQSVKKIYGGLYSGCEAFWIMDSEFLVLRRFDALQVYHEYSSFKYIPMFTWGTRESPLSDAEYQFHTSQYAHQLGSLGKEYADFAPEQGRNGKTFSLFPRQGVGVKWIMQRNVVLQWIAKVESVRPGSNFITTVAGRCRSIVNADCTTWECCSFFELAAYQLFILENLDIFPDFRPLNMDDLAKAFWGKLLDAVYDESAPMFHDDFLLRWWARISSKEHTIAFVSLANYLKLPLLPASGFDWNTVDLKLAKTVFCSVKTAVGLHGDLPLAVQAFSC